MITGDCLVWLWKQWPSVPSGRLLFALIGNGKCCHDDLYLPVPLFDCCFPSLHS